MQFPVDDSGKPPLETKTKVGIGVGAGGAALVFGALIWLFVRSYMARKRKREALGKQTMQASVTQRAGNSADTRLMVHEVEGTQRKFQGKKYAGVNTMAVNY
jgi:hypothetical protein